MPAAARFFLLALVLVFAGCDVFRSDDDGADVPLEGMVAYFPLDGTAVDATGTLPEAQAFGVVPTQGRNGDDDGALLFDGVDDGVTIAHAPEVNFGAGAPSYTISLWMRAHETTHARIVEKWNRRGDSPYPVQISITHDGLVPAVFDGSQLASMNVPGVEIDRWHHLAFVVDDADRVARMYLDGQLSGTAALPSGSVASDAPIKLGYGPETGVDRFFAGVLDDLRLYDRALTGEEIGRLAGE